MMVMTGTRDLREAPVAVARPAAKRRWLLGLLFTALLLAGLFQTALLVADGDDSGIMHMSGDHLVATGRLDQLLDGQLAPVDQHGLVASARYRDASGVECRSFGREQERFTSPIAGVACQIDGLWRVVELRQDAAATAPLPAPAQSPAPTQTPALTQ